MNLCTESLRAKLVVFTDEPLLAFGVSHLLSGSKQFEFIPAEPQLAELLPLVKEVQPDIILVDLTPEMTITLLAQIHENAPGARLIMWARSCSDELLAQAQEFGITGVINRTCSKEIFLEKLLQAAAGDTLRQAEAPGRSTKVDLTHRESQLVTLLSQGLKNKEIATCLGITEATVKAYLSRLFQKVGARDRFELALFGLKNTYCGQAWWDGPNGFVMEPQQERAAPLVRSLVLVEPARRQGCPQARLA